MNRIVDRSVWDSYMREFHAQRPGITEAVLSRCVDDKGATPYAWLVAGVEPTARTLDVACGSAPTRPLLTGRWLGVDRSESELKTALNDHGAAVVQGDASCLPVCSGSVDVVIVSMALMLIDPLSDALDEIHRVLVPGGELRALLPSTSSMTIRDLFAYVRLAIAARSVPRFPPTPLGHSLDPLEDAKLTVTGDDRRRFRYPLTDEEATRRFVASWYTPRTSTESGTGRRSLAWLPSPAEVKVPLRLIRARRD